MKKNSKFGNLDNRQNSDQNKELLISLNNQIVSVIRCNCEKDNKIGEGLCGKNDTLQKRIDELEYLLK